MEHSADFGILVTVAAKAYTYLFMDETDRKRYMSSLIKALNTCRGECGTPVIAGLSSDSAKIFFMGGDEEPLRYLIRTAHASYGIYKKAKGCAIEFSAASYRLIEGLKRIAFTVQDIRRSADYICVSFEKQEEAVPPGTLAAHSIKLFSGKLSDGTLAEMAEKYAGIDSFSQFVAKAEPWQIQCAAKELRQIYGLTYKEIGEIFSCSSTTAHRLVNKAS